MKVLYKQKEFKCVLCNKIISNNRFTRHLKIEHNIDSLIKYAFFYDKSLIKENKCLIWHKKRTLESLLQHPNSQTCSTQCDYKNKIKNTVKNNGENFLKERALKALSSRDPKAFSCTQLKYWINKGYTQEEAKIAVSNFNKIASKRCLEHYLAKGNSIEKAKDLLSKYQ